MKTTETAVLHMTDLHFGRRTPTFNPVILEKQLHKLSARIATIREELRSTDMDLVVLLTGDVLDGNLIYPTQIYHQVVSDPMEQAQLLSRLLGSFLPEVAQHFRGTRVECVAGNHGRVSKFSSEATNWDRLAYTFLEKEEALSKRGIVVKQNTRGEPFLRKIGIRGHRFLLYHGQDIRMYQQIPWYGITQRVLRWTTTRLAPFNGVFMGHFHTCGQMGVNRVEVFLSGTPVTHDEWALQVLGLESVPKWWFVGVSDKYPVVWSRELYLAE